MSKMKIVFLINSLDGGGAERVVSTLLNNLVAKYECYLILMENNISYELDSRINILSLNEDPDISGIKKFIRLPMIAYKLSRIISKYNFTQIVSFMYRSNYINILAKYFTKHKVIISERIAPTSMYDDSAMSSKISRFLIRNLYNNADLIISVSKAIQNDLIDNFNIKISQIVIYNPYDIKNINELSHENIDVKIDKEKSIITVGSLNKRKNQSMIIKAFKTCSKTHKLYILGVGEEEKTLKDLAKELNIEDRVIFLGFDNNPYKYLSKCDIFVLSSNSEGFPNVLVEAMICGCSVISTDCLSGPREILSPSSDIKYQLTNSLDKVEYGLLTPINNENILKEALELMINNDKLRDNYSEKSKQRANDFKIEKIIKQYKDAICAE